jgi:hypothetical protein
MIKTWSSKNNELAERQNKAVKRLALDGAERIQMPVHVSSRTVVEMSGYRIDVAGGRLI